jgi:hypothetical protein
MVFLPSNGYSRCSFLFKSCPHIQGKSGIPTTLILLSMIVEVHYTIVFHLYLNFLGHIIKIGNRQVLIGMLVQSPINLMSDYLD